MSGRGVSVQSVLILLVCVAGIAIYLHQPPRVVHEKAPLTAFSAEHAMKCIQAIARQPHPAGSMAIHSVRETIMEDIRACGIKPDVQETVVNHVPGSAASVRNILARVPGTANTKAVALAAHYDSVMYGPGAADDGSGVAALLETMRALKAGPPLRNDVMFIFTDGEEGVQPGKGLRGAYGFALQHPWAKEIGVVLNFDARGVTGPSYMYRTSPENGWLIRQMIAAGCHPIANSCMGTLAGLMPTNSDFSAFQEAGIPGLDFAFVGNIMRYHTSLDTPANLNPRSLQHHGEYALQLARRFGNLPLDNPKAPPAIFFNPLGAAMVAYPVAWALPLAVAALLALAVLLGAGIKRGAFTAMDLLRGLATFLAYILVAALAALAMVGVGCMRRGYYLIYSSDVLMLALICLAVWGFFLLLKRLRPAISERALNAGALLVWAALLLATSIGFPGASYVFLWPLAFGTAGLALLVFRKSTDDAPPAWMCAAQGLAAIPGILIIAPIVYDVHTTLTVVFAPATIAILALAFGLLIQPAYWLVAANPGAEALRAPHRLLPAAALTLGLALLLAAVFWPGFSPEQPKLTSLSYALDADTNQAYWLSSDAKSDEWTSAVIPRNLKPEPLGEFLSDDTQKVLKAPATAVDLTPASIEVLESTPIDNGRRLRIRVASRRHAPRVVLFAEPGVRIRAATVNGKPLLPVEGRWLLNYDILLARGIDLTLDVEGNAPFQLTAVEHSPELPDLKPNPLPLRPPYMIVKPNTPDLNRGWLKSNVTLVKKTFTL